MAWPSPSPVIRFFFALLVVMPLCLGAWWFLLRDYLVIFLQQGAHLFSQLVWADTVLAIDTETDTRSGAVVWVLKTSLSPIDDPRQLLAVPIATSRFTISFPLFWGLALATPNNHHKDRQLLFGTLLLIPITLFIALLIVQFKLALHINHQPVLTERPIGDYLLTLPYDDVTYYLMAVGRQLGMLVLPTLSPLLVWGALNRGFIRSVIFEGLLSRAGATLPSERRI